MSGVNAKSKANETESEVSNVNGVDGVQQSSQKSNEASAEQRPKVKSQISMVDLDRMVAESLKDVDMDDEDDNDDDDATLLNELSQIIHPGSVLDIRSGNVAAAATNSVLNDSTVPKLLKERIEMYKIAEANANAANESSRARRFGRGLSTLETMLKDALEGKSINMEDAPPEVITGGKESGTSTKVQ